MTPAQDRRAANVQEEAWHAHDCYAEMVSALRASGYRSYAQAQTDGLSADPEERARWGRFHARWSALMCARCGLAEASERVGVGRLSNYSARSTTDRRTVKRSARDPEPLTPALVAEPRALLAAQMAASLGKSGRPRGPRIEVTGRGD